MPSVKQERIAAEDVLLPSLPPDVGTRVVCRRPVLYPSDGELFDERACTYEPTSPQVDIARGRRE